jgi:hypothetical protein
MNLSPASHPDPVDLLAYADGDASLEVEAHVERCPACASQVDELAGTQAALRRTLYRFDCPDPLALGEYALSLLGAERQQQTAAHVVECEACTAELQWLREYLASDPPLPDTVLGRVRRVVATLLTPAPLPSSGLAVLRGAATSTTRLYEAGGLTISISSGDEPGHIVGLLVADATRAADLEGCTLRLMAEAGDVVSLCAVDDLGNFELEGVPSGTYTLEVDLPQSVVAIEGLQVY